jgi:cytochrome c oxidase cbb3-type subunit 3
MYRVSAVTLAFAAAACISAQTPTTPGTKATIAGSPAALKASKENPEAVARGADVFTASCARCHGATAKGTNRAPDLIRSLLVLDDEKGILIAPVIRTGRPDKGMPKLNLSEAQIADVVAWLHVQTFAADHRNTYLFLDALTGDPKKGETYFNAKCASCHSATGDLQGIGAKYDAHNMQGRWLQPKSFGRGAAKSASTVTVTTANGKTLTGTLDRLDDFNVTFHDAAGDLHSINRASETNPRIDVKDPLKIHTDMLRQYTDDDIHNVTAFLETLK